MTPKTSRAAGAVQFRLTGTPDGNLLVSFYHLDTVNQEAVNWHIASLLIENKMNAEVLYEGNLQNNTAAADRALPTGNLQPAQPAGPPERWRCMSTASELNG